MVSSSGDPMVFIPLKDAQEAQFLKDNQAIWQSRHRTESNTPFSPNTVSEADKLTDSQFSNHLVNAILVRIKPHTSADEVAESIRRWKHLTVYTRVQMENILIGKLIATSAKQISMFLIILAVVSAAIVAFIIYTLTMDKIREIAVLKLIGTRNRTIAAMILQQALALGVIGFAVGKITATFAAPLFPKYVLLIPTDSLIGFFAVLIICALASVIAIRIALQVDPAEAIGG
jgi:putative ABC transport system permease protein